ncbi:hypothetical protein EES43_15780 [Streptomyces sp. ADI96-02]|uniref:hypothetical protein n=1 Tax=Streptomyces sp. ADI96-02 TaxID=1522760 RepID=UPI000F557E23|nr:hypothetical protein [Streptomyces sp. ADI96-02]RPK61283.1 hypothetical protein EES43_15780 [Streptomyces sp. ADI96-02]
MSKPSSPNKPRPWIEPGAWSKARLIAVGYIGLAMVTALAYEFSGRPGAADPLMNTISFPGAVVVLVFVLYPLALLVGDDSIGGEAGFNLLNPLFHGAGALVNVLIVWGCMAFVRYFGKEARRSGGR